MPSPPRLADRDAFRILTRHFLVGLSRPRLLDEAGQEGLHRVLIGIAAGCLTGGLLMTRIFAVKYAGLAAMTGTQAHELALLADTAFVLAIPMLVIALLATLEAESLFPDDVDYRVCMVLPVRRSTVFVAKLAALGICAAVTVLVIEVALLPLLLLMHGSLGLRGLAVRLPVLLFTGSVASMAALTTVVALHGVVLTTVPSHRRDTVTLIVRSTLLVVLVALVPLVVQLSSAGEAIAARAAWVGAVPPLWFAALEQWLLGRADQFLGQLAWRGETLLAATLVLSVLAYVWLYRRFDGAATSTMASHPGWRERLGVWRRSPPRAMSTACGGVYSFAVATLRRSPLHQGVFAVLAACGVGIAVQHGFDTRDALLGLPFVLVLLCSSALRCALALPHQWRANWIFRQAEREASRPLQLRAVSRLFWRAGILGPTMAAALVQVAIGAPDTLVSVPVAILLGWLFVEILLRAWRRIPFTCTYLPRQRPAAHAALIALNTYVFFIGGGVALARTALSYPRPVGIVLAVVVTTAVVLGVKRRRLWSTAPLEFDAVPEDQPQALGVFV